MMPLNIVALCKVARLSYLVQLPHLKSKYHICASKLSSSSGGLLGKKLIHDKSVKYKLVIFDKDGTLICFHTLWTPWVRDLTNKLVSATGLEISNKVFNTLGVCEVTKKTIPGLLAEGTHAQIKIALNKLLIKEGFDPKKANDLVAKALSECRTSNDHLKELYDLSTMFRVLKQHGIKIAVCTSDRRAGTLQALKKLETSFLVDHIVCSDDPTSLAKPDPHNALMICNSLNVHPESTVMVGDTKTDMEFAKNAKLGMAIGVLTGVGEKSDLVEAGADITVKSIEDILGYVIPEKPINLTEAALNVTQQQWKLVIFDKDGSLAEVHTRWRDWAQRIGGKLASLTSEDVTTQYYSLIGYSPETEKIASGLLAQGTLQELQETLETLLTMADYSDNDVNKIIKEVWDDCSASVVPDLSVEGIRDTLETLKQRDVKIAILTSDTRHSLMSFLEAHDLTSFVDYSVCGDDSMMSEGKKKTAVTHICEKLSIQPEDTLVIGDSRVDLTVARSAKVGAAIAVLNGFSSAESVLHYADIIIPNVNYLRELINTSAKHPNVGAQCTSNPGLNIPVSRRGYSTVAREPVPSYDYVIVGAGSAGCVLANRLTEDPNTSVLLVEAGPKDHDFFIHMPAALMYNLCTDRFNWYYHTLPQKHMDNRVMYWPRGRVLGGSSSLNAMAYVRGHAFDYNRWEKEGAAGWSYANCLPYFKKAQTHDDLPEDDYVGASGPLHVSRGHTNHPLHLAFIEAGREAGYPVTQNMNGYQQEGVGFMDMTVHEGLRWSTASAYLKPVIYRRNLTCVTEKLARRILFDKKKAIGIELENFLHFGSREKVHVNNEVILSGGAINSPQLLMLSGVGNADHLRSVGIESLHHLPGVGENLQDHLELYVQQACTKPITLYSAQWKFPWNMVKIGLEWISSGTGWGATSHLESGGFIRTESGVPHPDIQFHFLPSTVSDHGRKAGACHAYQVHVGPMRPESRGYLRLKSANHREHPLLEANYMSTERDRWEMRAAIRASREIFAQPAFDAFRGVELQPGEHARSDDQLNAFIRSHADSAYHPSCTCKMGSESDPMAVTNHLCSVIGLEQLRVVDASIMPSIVSGNLNAPTIMLAEKAADIIKGVKPLSPSSAPTWTPRDPTRQRDENPIRRSDDSLLKAL